MSIGFLATAATAATQPAAAADEGWVTAAVVFAAAAAALVVAWRRGALRPAAIRGPVRVATGEPAGLWVAAAFVTFGGLLVAVAAYGILRPAGAAGPDAATQPATTQPVTTRPAAGAYGAADTAVFSATTPLVALAAGLAFLAACQPGAARQLGVWPGRVAPGLRAAVSVALVAVPVTFAASILTEAAYRLVGYEHPNAHDLLKTMNDLRHSLPLQVTAIAAAVLAAPLAEEFLFRGLLQTALAAWFGRFEAVRADPVGFPVVSINPVDAAPVIRPLPEPVADDPRPRAAARWAAVLLTAGLFALVHPLWSAPIIFVLAVILGHAYERTGNLWVPVGVHALFNAASTALYLLGSTAS